METEARETKVDESHETLKKTGSDLSVEKSLSVGSDTDPSISGVVNGNVLSTDLEENQNSTSASETENNEGSTHFNNAEINEKNSDKVLLHMNFWHFS